MTRRIVPVVLRCALVGWLMIWCGSGCHDQPSTPKISMKKQTTAQPFLTQARFIDIAQEFGVDFVPRNGVEAGHTAILESLGSGVAVLDYDLDGLADLFIPGGGEFSSKPEPIGLPAVLYRQGHQRQFIKATSQAGIGPCPFYSHGVNVGDVDSDGFPDVLISGYHGLQLYQNMGDGTFIDVTSYSGLKAQSWSTSTAWGDADGDGTLDLYVVNYVDWSFANNPACMVQGHRDICPPTRFEAQSHQFFLGNGDGTFRDASKEVGLVSGGKGLGVVAADLDLDGDLDYYVANDTTPNFLYRNDGRGHFEEVGLPSGTAFGEMGEPEGSMGVDVGDFNGDGLPDLFVSNFENQSFGLYRNEGDCRFQHVSATTGVTAIGSLFVGFGTVFFDFDGDGDEDIFGANGHVMNKPENATRRQFPILLENIDGKRFVNVASTAGKYLNMEHLGRGVACEDLNQDGTVDLVVSHTNEPMAILDNQTLMHGAWLRVRLIGIQSHRDAIGARITVKTANRCQTKQIKGGSSYLSSSSKEVMFGLADATRIESLEVVWPGGRTQTVPAPKIKTMIRIKEAVSGP